MRLNKSALLFAAVVAAAGLAGSPASASSSALDLPVGALTIVEVGTDAMGSDTFANRNREFVTFKVTGGGPVDIDGLVVQDNWSKNNGSPHTCNKYVITGLPGQGSAALLAAGETVTVYNGSRWGGNYKDGSAYRLYAKSDVDCGASGHFLNNDADSVWLTSGATQVASKSWDWNGGYTVN
ncbi:lamin tail domain-containing protein [Nonomuraea sp. PA05]|uniref:lamin tail domain-containing protein n=1 Tax=Nonomuraea sp. PA05 TaxID=2604466 RepID=UPI0011D4C850|nr:lamin tail domain-containing protein [Nonomuraea sp. PA05]TYB69758.1 lamin tail domain-containing protein [Nonomuraea sp. PA05]